MKDGHNQSSERDPATRRGVGQALNHALGVRSSPLLLDRAADAAFAAMIDRLRGEPGTSKGGNHG